MNWTEMSLAEQLGNMGSEFERAVRWKAKRQSQLAMKAAERTLEQMDKTLADSRHRGHRRRELARLRDEICQELFGVGVNEPSVQQLQRYFLAFATAVRRERS
jgi:hypothetical protein